MSYLVTISFDLYDAEPEDYKCIRKELEDLGLYNTIEGDNESKSHLPTTTLVGKFNNSDAGSLRDDTCNKVKRVFQKCKVKGEIFVAVGGDWAWGIRNT